jgi:hypothetical protein
MLSSIGSSRNKAETVVPSIIVVIGWKVFSGELMIAAKQVPTKTQECRPDPNLLAMAEPMAPAPMMAMFMMPLLLLEWEGVGLSAMPNVLPQLASGALVRVLRDWYADAGPISLYFASQKLLPAKTRAFVDFVIEQFRAQQLAQRFLATQVSIGHRAAVK